MPLYEVAIVKRPTKKEVEENGAVEELILEPTYVVANTPQNAVIKVVTTLNGKAAQFDPNKCDVLVRNFVPA